ncbi:MAG TPA: AMP-binding protein [Casimicrobiaceae bacterium]|nr:AMP-binding protein [Casimicrobiaceae bacterium]
MNVANLLLRTARRDGDRPAIAVGRTVVHDYRRFATRASAVAASCLDSLALRPGDRVAIFAGNCAEYLELMYAAWIAGLVVVPINNKLHAKEAAFIVEDSGAAVVFASDELAASLVDAGTTTRVLGVGDRDYAHLVGSVTVDVAPRLPEDLAWLFYTSGTTGRPKGVMLTHRNLLAMTLCYFADVDDARSSDSFIYAAPMSHGAGLYNIAQVVAGARHVVPESGTFDADEIFSLADCHGDATMFAAPTMVKRLVDHARRAGVSSDAIRTIVYGGAPMYAVDILDALDVMGNRFVQIYGQGESPMTITALSRVQLADRAHRRYRERIASVGIAQTAVEVRVADETGEAACVGSVGEVLVRGETVMLGYWNQPEATQRALRDGWLWTGDMGMLDDDGFLTLIDRSKDLIISGGANIYPREVEEVLLTHAGVREACVVGRPHADWGEEVVAFVVRNADAAVDAPQLDALCLASIARFKRPKVYRFVDALPKNNYGKVLKREVRAWASGGDQPTLS